MKKLYSRLFIYVFLTVLIMALLPIVGTAQSTKSKKPVIGISSTMGDGTETSVPLTYINAVIRAGGVPVVIPVTDDREILSTVLDRIDAVIMTGGEDIDPLKWYGEQPIPQLGEIAPDRDAFDIALIRLTVERGLPLLGICRGEQLLNVAFGGTLYQDLPSQYKGYAVSHRQKAPGKYGTHSIYIEKNSLLHKMISLDSTAVNSFHHQAVKDVAPGFRVTAVSKDGVVEAIEKIGSTRVYGVQFHPEIFTANGIDTFIGIFRNLVQEANK
jgi:putative glutamine amidotransferase